MQVARINAAVSVNKKMLILYWKIGEIVMNKQKKEGWGTQITRRLSDDLRRDLSDAKGMSYTNIRYMLRFAKEHPDLLV